MPKKAITLGVVVIIILIIGIVLSVRANLNSNNPIFGGINEPATSTPTTNGTTTDPNTGGNNGSTNTDPNSPVILDMIKANATVTSPLTVAGKARGNWFFEANLPIKITDASGKVLGQVGAQAVGEWMTTNYVPFSATLTFTAPTSTAQNPQTGFLIIEKDNPSGLPENDASVKIPVMFGAASTTVVKLFYPNPIKNQVLGDACLTRSMDFVERSLPITKTPIQDTIRLLIAGEITASEKSAGYQTEFTKNNFKLTAASLSNDGTLSLTFSDPDNFTSGGSCRVSVLKSQIELTALQFSDVKSVVFKPTELFQP
jgi:hypothetical protein